MKIVPTTRNSIMQYARINKLQALIIDMDGVLWRGSEPVGDLPLIFSTIQSHGWRVILATNNATQSVDQILKRLKDLKVNLSDKQIITSGEATAWYLHKKYPDGGPVFVIGEEGLQQILHRHSFFQAERDVLAVIVSLDRAFTYQKLSTAMRLINDGALFIGTNPDRTFPSHNNLVPGAGALIAAVESATGYAPLIIGKPQPEIFLAALDHLDTPSSETMVIGDRLETDIAGGKALGCSTALVLSGVTSIDNRSSWITQPDLVADNLSILLELA